MANSFMDKAKSFVKTPIGAAVATLTVVVLILLGWYAISHIGGGNNQEHMNAVPGEGLLTDKEYDLYLKKQAKADSPVVSKKDVQPSGNNSTEVVAPTVIVRDNTSDNSKVSLVDNTDSLVLSLSRFEDWVDGDLKLGKTSVKEFKVFTSQEEAQVFVDEYQWNKDQHGKEWNIGELALFVANKHGDEDPAPTVFFTDTDCYLVALSNDKLTPDMFVVNEDGKLESVDDLNGKTVQVVDKLAKKAKK